MFEARKINIIFVLNKDICRSCVFLYLGTIWALGLGIIWALFGHYLGTRLGTRLDTRLGTRLDSKPICSIWNSI